MADDQISIELLAKIDGLTSGLTEAVNAMRSAVESMKGDVHSIADVSKESEGALESILSIEKFRLFAEAAKVAMETVREAFEHTVGKAEEFGLATAKFAAMMGTNEEQAAGLAAALANVGSSTETYETLALRLEKSLRATGGASAELKDQFKDANGEFLTGAPLMERLKEVTDSYAEGSARTSVELALLGRGTKAYYDISRVTAESVEHNTEIYRQMGVDFATLTAKSRQLEEAEGDLRTAWQAEQVVIGQELMPVAMAAMQWLGGPGKELLSDLATGVKFLMTTFDALKATVVSAVSVIMGVLDGLWQSLKMGGKILYDVVHGDYGDIAKDFKAGMSGITDAAKTTAATIKQEWDGVADHAKALWDPEAGATPAPKKGGKSAPAHLNASHGKGGKTKEDRAPDDAIKAQEKLDLEKVSLEESTNQHLLAMGQESVEQFISQQRQLENEKYGIKLAALNQELGLHGRTKLEEQKTRDEIRLLEQTHVDALVKIRQDGETRLAAVSKEHLADAMRADDERLKEGMAEIQEEVSYGKIAADQKALYEMQLTRTIRGEQLARLDAMLATLTPETKAYEEMLRQRQQLEKQFTSELKTQGAERRQEMQADARQMMMPFTSGFKTAINDMLFNSKSFEQSMKDMCKNVAQSFVSMAETIAENYIEKQIMMALVGKSEATSTAITQMSANTGVAATGAASSQAAIPIIGPALAVAAAAAMVGALSVYEGLAHAEGGMLLDRDRLVYAHKDEQILPAHLSKGLQALIAGGGQGASQNTLNYSPTINAKDSASLDQLLRDQGGSMMAWLAQKSRDGAFKSRL